MPQDYKILYCANKIALRLGVANSVTQHLIAIVALRSTQPTTSII